MVAALTVTVGVDDVGTTVGAVVVAVCGGADVKVGVASVPGFCAGRLQAKIASISAAIAKVRFRVLFMASASVQ